ncbi:unnamed protein product [Periconia digitata]|uniref:DUF7607 domain-containing protein n=1 Tax=Periconia digitata TaxID=1303443 RepID=A0A9W4UD15_9PLEO|nr:unnamed protein product [Periconia digitata]
MASDPNSWSTDDLVEQLCSSTSLYETVNCAIPDNSTRHSLETAIRRKGIDGATLFQAVNTEVQDLLGDDTYVFIVRHLKSLSTTLGHQITTESIQALETKQLLMHAPYTTNVKTTTTWDHLQHWSHAEDAYELCVLDESEDTIDDDEQTEYDDDPDDERPIPDVKPRTGRLSDEEVRGIINECIEIFTANWPPERDQETTEDYDTEAFNLWTDAEDTDRRSALVTRYNDTVGWLESRIDSLADRIRDEKWKSADEVRRQCHVLEESVQQLEQAKWLLSIYELEPEDEEPEDEESNDIQAGIHPEVIDLGSDLSDDREETVDVHSLESATHTFPKQNFPALASIQSVAEWDWASLVRKKDRKRIVMKVIYEMSDQDREMVRERVNSIK